MGYVPAIGKRTLSFEPVLRAHIPQVKRKVSNIEQSLNESVFRNKQTHILTKRSEFFLGLVYKGLFFWIFPRNLSRSSCYDIRPKFTTNFVGLSRALSCAWRVDGRDVVDQLGHLSNRNRLSLFQIVSTLSTCAASKGNGKEREEGEGGGSNRMKLEEKKEMRLT